MVMASISSRLSARLKALFASGLFSVITLTPSVVLREINWYVISLSLYLASKIFAVLFYRVTSAVTRAYVEQTRFCKSSAFK